MQPEKMDRTDQELLGRALDGDTEAFGDLYERYLDEIQRFVFYRVADRFEAEDLTEVVFIKAWEALPRFESSNVNLRAWLYRIAHNTIIDHYRTRRQCGDPSFLGRNEGESRGKDLAPVILRSPPSTKLS